MKEYLKNLTPDGGLYMPETIPQLPDSFFKELPKLSLEEISQTVLYPFFGADLPSGVFTFDAPVIKLNETTSILELFHGPTLSFKDFGTNFMAGLFRNTEEPLTVLCATSGDTGSAVAHAFYKQNNVRVFVLYPAGKISTLQEKQFATLGENVTAIEVDGVFDDCQRLVKAAFTDSKLNSKVKLLSANSINLARLLPQIVYYFRGIAQLMPLKRPVTVTVPSGNFGNLTAGLIAKQMGLKIHHFIAATNSNRAFLDYLESGKFTPRRSIETISNAMDVGDPSNFPRILKLFANSHDNIKANISSYSISDQQTRETISEIYNRYNYILDPHGAVGVTAANRYGAKDCQHLVLHTAHPAKFPEIVTKLIPKETLVTPQRLSLLLEKDTRSVKIKNSTDALFSLLADEHSTANN